MKDKEGYYKGWFVASLIVGLVLLAHILLLLVSI
jgi:hypothetical protein